jgi:hypothetical protein
MPAFSNVCAIWTRRTSPFVSRSVLSGEITPSSIRRSMYPRSTPDRLAASAREYSAPRPGYGARTAGVIAQGFSTRDVTRLEILVTDVETARSATSLEWIDKTSSWRMRPMPHARRFDHVGITVADLDTVTAFFVGLGLEDEGRMFLRHRYVAVKSTHGTGTGHGASPAVAWWLDTREDLFATTTAPTTKQVHAILWRSSAGLIAGAAFLAASRSMTSSNRRAERAPRLWAQAG